MSSEQTFESEASDESCVSMADDIERSNINTEDLGASSGVAPMEIGGLEVPHEMEDFRRVITPLSKDQLIELLAGACIRNQDIQKRVFTVICESRSHRRLYIKNLPFSANTESVLELFSQFGDVEEGIVLKKDGKSRGYAFVTFKYIESALLACKNPVTMNGRFLMVKLAADPFPFETKRSDALRRKLFVRNLGFETNEDSLSEVLGKYGELEESVILRTKSGESKGYGFVTFTSTEATIKALQQPHHIIDGRLVFVHQAVEGKARVPKNKENHSNNLKQTHNEVRDQSSGLLNQGKLLAPAPNLDFQFTGGKLTSDSSFLYPMEKTSFDTGFNLQYAGTGRGLFDDEYLSPVSDVDPSLVSFSNPVNDFNLLDNSSAIKASCNTSMRFCASKDSHSLKTSTSNDSNIPMRNSNMSKPDVSAAKGFNSPNGMGLSAKPKSSVHHINNDSSSETAYTSSVEGNLFSRNLNLDASSHVWNPSKGSKMTRSFLNTQVKSPVHSHLMGNYSSTPWMVSDDFKPKMKLGEDESGVKNAEGKEIAGAFAPNFCYKESPQFPASKAPSWTNILDRFGLNNASDNQLLRTKNVNKKCDSKRMSSSYLNQDTKFRAF
ncbi:RRM domain-containing protein [Cryptosporidium canis]|uniref:RRM domain-containing protein n=1 Tax=Cryptosporidium canis TaxID=195482 RepID=A0ABQ8P3N2_9CRYT|nr:RRM domain-containing protein [Cryptosporidium canis]